MRRQCHVTQKAPPKSLHGIAITLEKCFGLMISLSPHFQVSQQIPVHIRGIKTGRLQRQLGEYPNNGLQASMMAKLHEMSMVSQTLGGRTLRNALYHTMLDVFSRSLLTSVTLVHLITYKHRSDLGVPPS